MKNIFVTLVKTTFTKETFPNYQLTRKPYGFMQSSFWVIMMVHVMVCGDL